MGTADQDGAARLVVGVVAGAERENLVRAGYDRVGVGALGHGLAQKACQVGVEVVVGGKGELADVASFSSVL